MDRQNRLIGVDGTIKLLMILLLVFTVEFTKRMLNKLHLGTIGKAVGLFVNGVCETRHFGQCFWKE